MPSPTPRDMAGERALTLAQVAEQFQFTPRYLRWLIRRHNIRVLRSGRLITFDKQALDALDDALRTRPLTPAERLYRDALIATEPPETVLSTNGDVYFIASGDSIKIGVASDPRMRLATLQIGSPAELTLLGSIRGGADMERRLHRKFAEYRMRGEWFRLAGQLAAFVERFRDG